MSEIVRFTDKPTGKSLPESSEFPVSHESDVCDVAISELLKLGNERQIDEVRIGKIAEAIREYATSVKPEPMTDMDCFLEIGRCMVVPSDFKKFCKDTVGVDVEIGAYISLSSGGSVNFYHEVNVVDGIIIIDWTAKQFRQDCDKPYPLVYLNGGEEIRARWGPLGTRQF